MPRVEALVVNHIRRGPGQMTGLGGGATDLINTLTGGEYDRVAQQLDTLELALKVSIAASCIAGAFALAALVRGR
ncbi:MAG TPA: hypothetical protein VE074_13900 [Jatrophihabitantaceae bacterium]|nr:hypothetical protein [Jatrophihabitantaceae bacterium]